MDCGDWQVFNEPYSKTPWPKEDVLDNELVLYPNPVIDLSETLENLDHIVKVPIDLTHLPKGLYYVEIEGWATKVFENIIKLN